MTTPTPLPHAVAIQMCSDFDEGSQSCGDPNHSPVSCTCLKLAMTWRTMQRDLAAAQLELAELKRGKVLADGMSNVIRGFILKRAERETLDEVAAKYRKWEEDYSHSNFTKDAP